MSMNNDLRSAKRVPVSNRVNLMVKGRVILAPLALNISMGGMLLNAAAALPVGYPCEVAIFLPDGSGRESFVAQGKVVRNTEAGTAIQFANLLPDKALDIITRPLAATSPSLFQSYLSYFKVSQSKSEAYCEQVFGVSKSLFKRVTTISFLTSIPTAILPVWLLRNHMPAIPDWTKIAACFLYGALWLLVLQPVIDLTVIKALRAKAVPGPGSVK